MPIVNVSIIQRQQKEGILVEGSRRADDFVGLCKSCCAHGQSHFPSTARTRPYSCLVAIHHCTCNSRAERHCHSCNPDKLQHCQGPFLLDRYILATPTTAMTTARYSDCRCCCYSCRCCCWSCCCYEETKALISFTVVVSSFAAADAMELRNLGPKGAETVFWQTQL